MLCGVCRRQVPRRAEFCASCGAPVRRTSKRDGAPPALDLMLPDGTRVAVTDTVTIGRASDNAIQLTDRSVSRHHARVVADGGSPRIEDAGSSAGTYIDGKKIRSAPLSEGVKLTLGNVDLGVVRRPNDDDSGAGKTIVVKAGATILLSALGKSEVQTASGYGFRPRVRSGWAMKRLPASEGERRWILHDRRTGKFVRMKADEAALFELLDGKHTLVELMSEAEQRLGPRGAGTVASLLADLGEKGFLAGVDRDGDATEEKSRLQRLVTPRDFSVGWAGPMFETLYRRGGWVLFTPVSLALMSFVALAGMAVWIYLVLGRYGTPFVVAEKIGVGGLVFLLGRFGMVAFHELAHGLTVASFGRRVPRAGLKLMMVFPYAFVDTSEAWFEPKRRRLAISGAGPVCDFTMGGLFSLLAFATAGTMRDIFFNLAFAAYIGGLFNLNPFLERDGYHMAVDILREPGLRRRARAWLRSKLIGAPFEGEAGRALKIYAISSTFWLLSGLFFAIIGTKRFYPKLVTLMPREAVWALFALIYVVALLPVILVFVGPLLARRRLARVEQEADDGGG